MKKLIKVETVQVPNLYCSYYDDKDNLVGAEKVILLHVAYFRHVNGDIETLYSPVNTQNLEAQEGSIVEHQGRLEFFIKEDLR